MTSEVRIKNYKTTDPIYRSFVSMLRRKGVKAYGLVATLYFDVFFAESFRIKKDLLVNRGICSDNAGSFGAWRKEQRALELLDWTEIKLPNGKMRVDYKAGAAAIPYLNKATISSQQIATKDDVKKVKDDVQDLRAEVNSLKAAMGAIIEKIDPPNSDEKITFYTENPSKLAARLM